MRGANFHSACITWWLSAAQAWFDPTEAKTKRSEHKEVYVNLGALQGCRPSETRAGTAGVSDAVTTTVTTIETMHTLVVSVRTHTLVHNFAPTCSYSTTAPIVRRVRCKKQQGMYNKVERWRKGVVLFCRL
jgi:hypothetical protein